MVTVRRLLLVLTVTLCCSGTRPETVSAQDRAEYVLRTLWSVGGLDAPASEQFSGPFMATAIGPHGEALVLDVNRDLISVFDGRTGRFLREIGGPGQGPGELTSPGAIAWGPGPTLWVAGAFSGRYTLFDSAGVFLRTVPRPFHSVNRLVFPLAFSPDGKVVDHFGGYPTVRFVRVDTTGVVRDTFPVEVPQLDMLGGGPIRPGSPLTEVVWLRPILWWTFARDGRSVWMSRSDSLVLVQVTLRGDTLRRVVTGHRRGEFTKAQRDAIRRANHELGREGAFAPLLVQAIHGLDDGRLLIQIGSDMREPGREFDLFSAEGSLIGSVSAPFRIHHRSELSSRGDTLLLVAVGEYDVPLLIKAILERRESDDPGRE